MKTLLVPTDLWTALRLARCFVRRGNEEAAISLYRWCGANASYSRYTSSSRTNVTANQLVEEIRKTSPNLADILAGFAYDFRFEKIMQKIAEVSRISE